MIPLATARCWPDASTLVSVGEYKSENALQKILTLNSPFFSTEPRNQRSDQAERHSCQWPQSLWLCLPLGWLRHWDEGEIAGLSLYHTLFDCASPGLENGLPPLHIALEQ